MSAATQETNQLLECLRQGDPQARNQLLGHASERLRQLARKMLRGFPGVRRWEETDDVFQNAALRLHRALAGLTPKSSRHFWNLAAQHIRWELQSLASHYQVRAAKHHSDGKAADAEGGPLHVQEDSTSEPSSVAEWSQFHEQVQTLPDKEREVFNLLWYGNLTQEQASKELGVSLRTLKRRWFSAKIALFRRLHGGRPPEEPR
jgi:RNA polymerase sigma-70 factor (ECF subfamily)